MQPQERQPGGDNPPAAWPRRRSVARAPREAWDRPARVERVDGTPYGLLIYGSPPVTSGPAVGALVAGVSGAMVSLVVFCFGMVGANAGWGPWVAGAFGVLAAALGGGGVGLGLIGLRRTRRPPVARPVWSPGGESPAPPDAAEPAVRGRGLAIAGLVCGASALAVTAGSLLLSALLTVT